MSSKQRYFVYTIIVMAMMIWGMTFIWYKQVFSVLRPISLVFLRLLIASPVLITVTLLSGKLQRIQWKDLFYFLVLAFFEPFLYFIGESFGMQRVSSSLGSVIIATIPLFTPVAAYLLYKERFSTINVIGIFISVLGVTMVIAGESGFSGSTFWGSLLMFLAVFAAVGYSVLVKKLAASYSSFSIVSWQNTIGLLYFLPLFIVFERNHITQVRWSLPVIIPLVELAIFGSALAFVFFTYSIKRLGITRSTVFSSLIPVFAVLFSWMLLNDLITPLKIIGIAVVIGGLLLTQLTTKTRNIR
ncbi:MAG: DMT family transporter [Bacteroidales bacterium]|nr:DMT family transporter [Bacteroidales bacterium]